jgi:hypothetical protein
LAAGSSPIVAAGPDVVDDGEERDRGGTRVEVAPGEVLGAGGPPRTDTTRAGVAAGATADGRRAMPRPDRTRAARTSIAITSNATSRCRPAAANARSLWARPGVDREVDERLVGEPRQVDRRAPGERVIPSHDRDVPVPLDHLRLHALGHDAGRETEYGDVDVAGADAGDELVAAPDVQTNADGGVGEAESSQRVGMSMPDTVGMMPTARWPRTSPTAAAASATARSAASRARRAAGRNAAPAAVSSTLRLVRANSSKPSSRSSALI